MAENYNIGDKVKHLCYSIGEVVAVSSDVIRVMVRDSSISEGHKFFDHILSNENVPLPEKID